MLTTSDALRGNHSDLETIHVPSTCPGFEDIRRVRSSMPVDLQDFRDPAAVRVRKDFVVWQ